MTRNRCPRCWYINHSVATECANCSAVLPDANRYDGYPAKPDPRLVQWFPLDPNDGVVNTLLRRIKRLRL